MGYHVLIADDMAANRKLIKAVVEKEIPGITFSEVADGLNAMEVVQRGNVDLVILDLMMPGKDGFQVLSEMKDHVDYRDIPVVIYSAMESIDSINAALQLGAYDYFTKPLTPEQTKIIVPLKVKNALELHEQRKALVTIHENIKIELMMARLFQQNLMAEYKNFDNVEIYGRYLPCEELGGDFYDFLQVGDAVWFIAAGVSGQGVVAGMISAMLKVEFANCVRTSQQPGQVLETMNSTFYPLLQGVYDVSAFVAKIQGDTCWYANAGHPYPLLFNKQQQTELLEAGGPVLGFAPDGVYHSHAMPMESQDILLAYSDGLFASRKWNETVREYSELGHYLVEYQEKARTHPNEFMNVILQLYANVQSTPAGDDVSIILLKKK